MSGRHLFPEMQSGHIYFDEDSSNCSNFLDMDWLSSSGNSCEEELERYWFLVYHYASLSFYIIRISISEQLWMAALVDF